MHLNSFEDMHVSCTRRIRDMTALISSVNNFQGFVFVLVMLCLLVSAVAVRLMQRFKHDASSLTIKQLMRLCVLHSIHSALFPGKGLE